ncbi:MAG: Rrf2 family transcriptional regulator [Phycisphaerales bacterium]|nr:Rrf2 family transcriptional regulator [Phycisphaerales bacterium]
MFSSTSEYALRAAVYLAGRAPDACTSEQIALATKVPAGYLIKVLQDLARAGLVSSQRGPNGGFKLLRPPGEITALEVINAVDPINRILRCPLGIPAHSKELCPMHRRLDHAIALVEQALSNSTLTDMTEPAPARGLPVFPMVHGKPLPPKPAKRKRA